MAEKKKKEEKDSFRFFSKEQVFGRTREEVKDLILKQVEKTAKSNKLTEKEKKMQVDALSEVFLKGKPAEEAMGLDDDIMQVIYSQAYKLYNSGNFNEANQYFKFLSLLDPTPKNFLGLAASFHQLKDYDNAIQTYFSCAYMEPDNPVPYFYIYDCYEKLNNPFGVMMALNGCIVTCGLEPKYVALKTRCLAILGKLKGEEPETNKISEEGKEEIDYFKQLQQPNETREE